MSLQLCWSCRNSFPSDALTPPSFTENIVRYFQQAQSLASAVQGKSHEDVDKLQRLQITLQELCAAVNEGVNTLQFKLKQNDAQRANREQDLATANAKAATTNSPQKSGLAATRSLATTDAAPLPTFNGTVPVHQQKKMSTALDLISASVYSLLESVAIQTRVDTALLWIPPRGLGSMELVAPFVVGRNLTALRHSAPYCVPEMSMPCVVSSTGTAVNIKPRNGVRDLRRTEDIPLIELIDTVNVAQLLMPVFSRYGQEDRTVIAVIHLIGSPRFPYPFTRADEHIAMQAATFFSTTLSSHHSTMVNEWTNHFYNPAVLQSTSTFRGDLDLRGDEKGLDDFQALPTLIYRAESEDTRDADPREVYKALRGSMARHATPVYKVAAVKDLNRFASNMEKNWVSAVEANSRLEGFIGNIRAQAVVRDVEMLKDMRETVWKEKGSSYNNAVFSAVGSRAEIEAPNPSEDTMPLPENSAAAGQAEGKRPSVNILEVEAHLAPATAVARGGLTAAEMLKPEELAELEVVALRRLRDLGVDTSAFETK